MNTGAQSTQMFDATIQWLMDQGLQEISIEEIARGLGKRLVAGGIPIHRISIGGMMLHPVFGAMDISWEAQSHCPIREISAQWLYVKGISRGTVFPLHG